MSKTYGQAMLSNEVGNEGKECQCWNKDDRNVGGDEWEDDGGASDVNEQVVHRIVLGLELEPVVVVVEDVGVMAVE